LSTKRKRGKPKPKKKSTKHLPKEIFEFHGSDLIPQKQNPFPLAFTIWYAFPTLEYGNEKTSELRT